jgi:hypothetical protein
MAYILLIGVITHAPPPHHILVEYIIDQSVPSPVVPPTHTHMRSSHDTHKAALAPSRHTTGEAFPRGMPSCQDGSYGGGLGCGQRPNHRPQHRDITRRKFVPASTLAAGYTAAPDPTTCGTAVLRAVACICSCSTASVVVPPS